MADIAAELTQLCRRELAEPRVTVTAVQGNRVLQELCNALNDGGEGGGQTRRARVTPAGTVPLPAIGSITAAGLSIKEFKREIEAAYATIVTGLEVTPILERRAPSFVYVVGEVAKPGRRELQGPTTALQTVAAAGSVKLGANQRQVIVYRQDARGNLMATPLDLRQASKGRGSDPAGEVWLRDGDIVLVTDRAVIAAAEARELLLVCGAGQRGGTP
jgi:polysaccharide export outer membrane protein